MARDPNTKHKINLEDEYGLLDNGEREFCLEKSVSPKDYYNVKRIILKELVFDPKYSLQALKSKCQGIVENSSTIDLIFEYVVSQNTQF